MQTKTKVIFFIIVFSLLLGTTTSGSFFYGDINMIDEGQFAAWANHMLHGKLLFRDIYITYGPLSVYPLFWLFQIFGASAFLVRLYLTIGGTLGIIASYLLMDEIKIKKWIVYFLLIVFLLIPVLNLREAVGLLALFLLLKSIKEKSGTLSLFAGIASLFSFIVSPDFGIFILIVACLHFLVSVTISSKLKKDLKIFVLFITGYFAVLVCFLLWALRSHWLKEYITGTIDIIVSISGINVPNGLNFPSPMGLLTNGNWSGLVKFLVGHEMLLYWSLCIYIAAIFYLVVKFIQNKTDKNIYSFLLITFFGILVYTILLTRHGSGHYFYTLPVNLIVSGYLFDKLIGIKKKTKVVYIFIFLIIIYLVRILYMNNPMIRKNLDPRTYLLPHQSNINRVGFLSISTKQEKKIAFFQKYISKNTSPKDYIFLFNDEPAIYMLVDRVNPTKFDLPFIGNLLEKRLDILRSLSIAKPKFIFIDNDTWPVDGISNKVRLPEVYEYIKKYYKFVEKSENVEVYSLQ